VGQADAADVASVLEENAAQSA